MPSKLNSAFFLSDNNFMDAVSSNDMYEIQKASIEWLELKDLERAFRMLEDANPDWMVRPASDITRGVITGLQSEINRMKEQSGSPTPS